MVLTSEISTISLPLFPAPPQHRNTSQLIYRALILKFRTPRIMKLSGDLARGVGSLYGNCASQGSESQWSKRRKTVLMLLLLRLPALPGL